METAPLAETPAATEVMSSSESAVTMMFPFGGDRGARVYFRNRRFFDSRDVCSESNGRTSTTGQRARNRNNRRIVIGRNRNL